MSDPSETIVVVRLQSLRVECRLRRIDAAI